MAVKRFKDGLIAKSRQVSFVTKELFTQHVFDIQGEAIRRAPINTGYLRSDTQVEGQPPLPSVIFDIERTRLGLKGTIVFLAEYAEVQHETLSFQHPKGGQAKFLESAMKAKKYSALYRKLQRSI